MLRTSLAVLAGLLVQQSLTFPLVKRQGGTTPQIAAEYGRYQQVECYSINSLPQQLSSSIVSVTQCLDLCEAASSSLTCGITAGGSCFGGSEVELTYHDAGVATEPILCRNPCDADPLIACGGDHVLIYARNLAEPETSSTIEVTSTVDTATVEPTSTKSASTEEPTPTSDAVSTTVETVSTAEPESTAQSTASETESSTSAESTPEPSSTTDSVVEEPTSTADPTLTETATTATEEPTTAPDSSSAVESTTTSFDDASSTPAATSTEAPSPSETSSTDVEEPTTSSESTDASVEPTATSTVSSTDDSSSSTTETPAPTEAPTSTVVEDSTSPESSTESVSTDEPAPTSPPAPLEYYYNYTESGANFSHWYPQGCSSSRDYYDAEIFTVTLPTDGTVQDCLNKCAQPVAGVDPLVCGITQGGVCRVSTRTDNINYSSRSDAACSSTCPSSNFRCGSSTLFTVYRRYSTYAPPQIDIYYPDAPAASDYSTWNYAGCFSPTELEKGATVWNITLSAADASPASCIAECSKVISGKKSTLCGLTKGGVCVASLRDYYGGLQLSGRANEACDATCPDSNLRCGSSTGLVSAYVRRYIDPTTPLTDYADEVQVANYTTWSSRQCFGSRDTNDQIVFDVPLVTDGSASDCLRVCSASSSEGSPSTACGLTAGGLCATSTRSWATLNTYPYNTLTYKNPGVCNVPCAGSSTRCGGDDVFSVYSRSYTFVPEPISTYQEDLPLEGYSRWESWSCNDRTDAFGVDIFTTTLDTDKSVSGCLRACETATIDGTIPTICGMAPDGVCLSTPYTFGYVRFKSKYETSCTSSCDGYRCGSPSGLVTVYMRQYTTASYPYPEPTLPPAPEPSTELAIYTSETAAANFTAWSPYNGGCADIYDYDNKKPYSVELGSVPSVADCLTACEGVGALYCGIVNGGSCVALPLSVSYPYSESRPLSTCNAPCLDGFACGSTATVTSYSRTSTVIPTTLSFYVDTNPVSGFNVWTPYYSCASTIGYDNELTFDVTLQTDGTVEGCLEACAQGSGEETCFLCAIGNGGQTCATTFHGSYYGDVSISTLRESACNTACDGDFWCGGSPRAVTVYWRAADQAPQLIDYVDEQVVEGFTSWYTNSYLSCYDTTNYYDKAAFPITFDTDRSSPASCLAACSSYSAFNLTLCGLTAGGDCVASTSSDGLNPHYGSCKTPCDGTNYACGGEGLVTLYQRYSTYVPLSYFYSDETATANYTELRPYGCVDIKNSDDKDLLTVELVSDGSVLSCLQACVAHGDGGACGLSAGGTRCLATSGTAWYGSLGIVSRPSQACETACSGSTYACGGADSLLLYYRDYTYVEPPTTIDPPTETSTSPVSEPTSAPVESSSVPVSSAVETSSTITESVPVETATSDAPAEPSTVPSSSLPVETSTVESSAPVETSTVESSAPVETSSSATSTTDPASSEPSSAPSSVPTESSTTEPASSTITEAPEPSSTPSSASSTAPSAPESSSEPESFEMSSASSSAPSSIESSPSSASSSAAESSSSSIESSSSAASSASESSTSTEAPVSTSDAPAPTSTESGVSSTSEVSSSVETSSPVSSAASSSEPTSTEISTEPTSIEPAASFTSVSVESSTTTEASTPESSAASSSASSTFDSASSGAVSSESASTSTASSEIVPSSTSESVSGAPTAAPTPARKGTDPEFTYVGCISDARNKRTLKNLVSAGPRGWRVDACLNAIKAAGYSYGGLEFGGECWGGDEMAPTAKAQPASSCQYRCNDDAAFDCGGYNALDVYRLASVPPPIEPSPVSSSVVETPAPTGVPPPTLTASPKTTDNSIWSYTGCFSDSVSARSVPNGIRAEEWTVVSCLNAVQAAGYSMGGIIYGGECWGANALASTANALDASECRWKCNDSNDECGGQRGLDVYTLKTPTIPTRKVRKRWGYRSN